MDAFFSFLKVATIGIFALIALVWASCSSTDRVEEHADSDLGVVWISGSVRAGCQSCGPDSGFSPRHRLDR